MANSLHSPRLWPRLLGGLVAPVLLPLAGPAAEPEPVAAPGPSTPAACPAAQVLSLDESLRLALEKQPTLAALRASLASAQTQQQALEALCVPTFLRPDLPIRRQQAALGVNAATAGLHQAEWETVYAVTRTYLTVLHARSQEAAVHQVVAQLDEVQQTTQRLLKAAVPEVSQSDVEKLNVYLTLARTREVDARQAARRALAALREAIGLGPDCCLQPVGERIPFARRELCLGDLVSLALSRRGELVQATAAADLVCLEIDAQGATLGATARTFAAATDIHARAIPQGVSNGEYRPGAVSIEMPTTLVGCRSYRVERARELSARAAAVVDKTRNLIALEVEDQFLKWQQAAEKAAQLEKSPADAAALADRLRKRLGSDGKVSVEEVLRAQVLQGEAQAAYNEAVFQHALALAALERATAGGLCAGFGVGTAPQP
jgi:outer membrane protein TolC